ncbi:methyltransferase [Nocardioides bruguierae]|uniref:Methyltransferase domain-containing protein n=1 Tax=Nocardioides bruguierae TaxID=2945102 RepID=A0A9X2D942_9ACTN|nr:methyltransferase [Nocardioides bruguierae]MCL8027003.1 methyltransferase domain-containing protein [Nocardioides bruguierae]MCM0621630.1 methyltransferase domain-containing protein [Nocardioides bruguierae]
MAGTPNAPSTSERRAAVRTAVVWDDLAPVLERPDGAALDVLDIGGGTGGSAVRVAGLGHRVTVVDPSPDALASLARRAREAGVEVDAHQGDLGDLADLVGSGAQGRGADVVLCHGVLEFVTDPAAALAALRAVLRPGGTLSLLVAQRHAAVLARAMAGHFAQAQDLLAPVSGDPGRTGHRYTGDEVVDLVGAAGLEVVSVHGVRVFADLVPGHLLELETGSTAALVELERAVADRPEYLPLATQLHLVARG